MNNGEATNKILVPDARRQSRTIIPSLGERTPEERSLTNPGESSARAGRKVGRNAKNGRPRSSLKIHLDILETIRDEGPSKPTRIVLVANLSHDRLVRYVAELVSQGLLEESREDAARSYALTAKGLDFINQVRETEAFLAEFGLEM